MTIANAPTVSANTQPLLLDISNTTLTVTPAQFDRLCIELRSATDNLTTLKTKMSEYQRLGVRLGILINPQDPTVEIYRREHDVEVFASPMSLSCDDVMPGFVLNLAEIW
jgi:Uma2 family endonuclease